MLKLAIPQLGGEILFEATLEPTASAVDKLVKRKGIGKSEISTILGRKNKVAVGDYWREVVNYSAFQNIGDTWLSLSSYLIKPTSEYLTEGDLIYFVPYGSLHYLPMHALELNGEPLIKRHPVAYSPSASLIKFCQNKGSDRLQSCASFGMVFEEEAENIAELFLI